MGVKVAEVNDSLWSDSSVYSTRVDAEHIDLAAAVERVQQIAANSPMSAAVFDRGGGGYEVDVLAPLPAERDAIVGDNKLRHGAPGLMLVARHDALGTVSLSGTSDGTAQIDRLRAVFDRAGLGHVDLSSGRLAQSTVIESFRFLVERLAKSVAQARQSLTTEDTKAFGSMITALWILKPFLERPSASVGQVLEAWRGVSHASVLSLDGNLVSVATGKVFQSVGPVTFDQKTGAGFVGNLQVGQLYAYFGDCNVYALDEHMVPTTTIIANVKPDFFNSFAATQRAKGWAHAMLVGGERVVGDLVARLPITSAVAAPALPPAPRKHEGKPRETPAPVVSAPAGPQPLPPLNWSRLTLNDLETRLVKLGFIKIPNASTTNGVAYRGPNGGRVSVSLDPRTGRVTTKVDRLKKEIAAACKLPSGTSA